MVSYVIFGAGRVGASMAGYLDQLGHEVRLITHETARLKRKECEEAIGAADVVAAAIPDDQLSRWREHWSAAIGARTAIHFSGAITIDGMGAFHPLFSFPRERVAAPIMERIAFACPETDYSFERIFPGAPNPHFTIADDRRAHYHALAVLTGNLSSFVWNEAAKELEAYDGVSPVEIIAPYLESVMAGFMASPHQSMTGPVARRDAGTVAANREALANAPALLTLYDALLRASWPDYFD